MTRLELRLQLIERITLLTSECATRAGPNLIKSRAVNIIPEFIQQAKVPKVLREMRYHF